MSKSWARRSVPRSIVTSPALLARMTVVPYFPISTDVLHDIISLLGHVAARMLDSHGSTLRFAEQVVAAIASRCREAETGARNADHIIREHLLPLLSSYVLQHVVEGDSPSAIEVISTPPATSPSPGANLPWHLG